MASNYRRLDLIKAQFQAPEGNDINLAKEQREQDDIRKAEFEKLQKLFHQLHGSAQFTIVKAYLIENLALEKGFEARITTTQQKNRESPHWFHKNEWEDGDKSSWRKKILDRLYLFCNSFDWNNHSEEKVIPVVHALHDQKVCKKKLLKKSTMILKICFNRVEIQLDQLDLLHYH